MADSYGEVNIRREKSDGEFDFRCPREDFHSEASDDDTAFHVKNASANDGKGFAAWCMHDGCKHEWDGDRLKVLDTVCQDLGIEDALDLICPEWTPGVDRPSTTGTTSVKPEEISAEIDALDEGANPVELEKIYRMIAVLGRPPFDKQFADAIKEKTGTGKKEFDKCLSAERRKLKAIQERVPSDEDEGPPDKSEWPSLTKIELRWGHNDVVRMTIDVALELNRKEPVVFIAKSGQTCRLMLPDDGDDPILKPMQSGHWRQLLLDVEYISVNEKGDELSVGVPENIVSHLNGGALFEKLPRLDGITRVPVFNAEGQIMTKEGYDPKLKVYFSPSMGFRAVPTDGSAQDHVNWAVHTLLGEAFRDFPFSDKFRTDVDDLPIYREERDDKGYRLPNFERGVSSRAHALAMTLQPFARAMIAGATPMYFMDKSQPGAGAGYLANVPSITLEGKPATPQRMSSNDEEFAKAISASLFANQNIIFIDNVVRTIDSPTLAAAITTGQWTDRFLGKSEMVSVDVNGLWLIGGNNVRFTRELARRLVPIRLDAGMARPEDRPAGTFKHRMPRDYLKMRQDLVFACHILIQHWIDQGRPSGSAHLASFEDWSEVMSGILEAAGIEGFLGTLSSFSETNDESDDTASDLVKKMYKEFQHQEFKLGEFMSKATNGGGQFECNIGDRAKDSTGRQRAVQKFISQNCLGSPFDITSVYDTPITVQLSAGKTASGYVYSVKLKE